MKNRKRSILIGILILLLVLDAVLLCLAFGKDSSRKVLPVSDAPQQSTQVQPSESLTPETQRQEPTGEAATQEVTTAAIQTEPPAGTEPSVNRPVTGSQSLSFPYAIPNTDLVIQRISAYNGIFWEDGSDSDVENVTTIFLTNTGDVGVEYASITMQRGVETLEFVVSALPAGASVAVQEKNRTAFTQDAYSACFADIVPLEVFEMSENSVKIEETGEYSLSVTNLAGEEIPCIRVFYKFYTASDDVYIGGITYTSKILNLAPGETTTITPSHYAKGYSQVVMVRTYDTDS